MISFTFLDDTSASGRTVWLPSWNVSGNDAAHTDEIFDQLLAQEVGFSEYESDAFHVVASRQRVYGPWQKES